MKSETKTQVETTRSGMTTTETKKTYKLTEDCFVGKVGDLIVLENNMNRWNNLTQNKQGEPFAEWHLIKEVKE
jgi:hypothetical protein